MDENLYLLLKSFQFNFSGIYQLKVSNMVTTVISGTTYTVNQQEYDTTSSFTPIESIVFMSNDLPTLNEQIGKPYITEAGTTYPRGTDKKFGNFLTDISLPMTNGAESYLQNIEYVPSPYRMISMESNQSLKTISISIHWKCHIDGELYQVYLQKGGSVAMKIMFRKKK